MINNIKDLESIAIARWGELEDINPVYLSEAGHGAKEAYRAIIWHISFHEDLQSLIEDEEFLDLSKVPDKHEEYYKILRMVKNCIAKTLNK